MSRYNNINSTAGGSSSLGRTALFAAVFLALGGLLVFAVAEMTGGLDPSSTKTVAKTIVLEYNLGSYVDGGDGGGDGSSAYSMSYTVQFPDTAKNPIATTLQLYSEAGGQCTNNFSTFICEAKDTHITFMVTRTDTNAAWTDDLLLKAVNFY